MNFNWADDTNCAVTVCDTEGVIIYQNKQSISCLLYTSDAADE